MLKLLICRKSLIKTIPAAFRRLCVETRIFMATYNHTYQPPSGGCVLKRKAADTLYDEKSSRLQAAVC